MGSYSGEGINGIYPGPTVAPLSFRAPDRSGAGDIGVSLPGTDDVETLVSDDGADRVPENVVCGFDAVTAGPENRLSGRQLSDYEHRTDRFTSWILATGESLDERDGDAESIHRPHHAPGRSH